MDKKRLERANQLNKAIKSLEQEIELISKADKIILREDNQRNFTLFCNTESKEPDKVFAEEIRTTIFEYYKTKVHQMELRLKAL